MQTIVALARGFVEKFLENYGKDEKKTVLVLLGPTASGKTALSIKLGKIFDAEVISADSRQVYRHMNIGTDKIALAQREGIPHHLIDAVEPSERFTAADFKKHAEKIIDEIHARGKLPMIVGGTGLYMDAVVKNFIIPREDPVVRAKLMRELEEKGPEKLHAKLQEADPLSAARIHPRNVPYVVRALEICEVTGKAKSDTKLPEKYRFLKIGIKLPRDELFKRINERVDSQMRRGLLEETKKLLEMGFSKDLPAMKSLGYMEMVAVIDGAMTTTEAAETVKKKTRNYAKRQMTWFKRDREIIWLGNTTFSCYEGFDVSLGKNLDHKK